MFEVGSVIGGKYRVLSELGQGGMSTVYLVVNEKTNKLWAMKKVRKLETADRKLLNDSLRTEIETLKKLKHPNLPSVVEVIEQQEEYLVVMDYIEGVSLENLLMEKEFLDEEQVVRYAIQLCDVLSYLHTRKPAIIYRDMKPSNIVRKPDGAVVLIDFGTAREFKKDAMRDTNNLGTRGYAAPEQFGKNGQTDARTDIYCLGMTLYQLLTGQNPVEAPYEIYPITKWNSNLSDGLEKIIKKCIQKSPEDRFQSADELMQALLDYREYGIHKKKKNKKRIFWVGGMTGISVLCAYAALYIRRQATGLLEISSVQMIQQANILFVIAMVLLLLAIISFFSSDNRRKKRRRRRKGEGVPPPVTVELAPRTIYAAETNDVALQEDDADWNTIQDITYVHAQEISETEQDKTVKVE